MKIKYCKYLIKIFHKKFKNCISFFLYIKKNSGNRVNDLLFHLYTYVFLDVVATVNVNFWPPISLTINWQLFIRLLHFLGNFGDIYWLIMVDYCQVVALNQDIVKNKLFGTESYDELLY